MYNKLKTTILAFVIAITSAMAQAPNMINYQGAAHNANGTAIANQAIKLRLSIRTSTAAGTVQYSEVRNATTDASGLFNVQIGATGAVSTTGSWGAINWKSGAKYLQVEMDPTGGTTYINMGTQQLVSVPYAQHAKEAGSLIPTATINPSQINSSGAVANQVLQFNGTNWIPANVAGASTFTLPYITTDANLVSLGITNTNASGGSAFFGKTTANSITASGIKGESTAAKGNGVYGKSAGANSFGVVGENPLGVGVYGKSNTASYGAVQGINTITGGKGVVGIANTGTNSMGVEGNANAGIGVSGYSNTNIGVQGGSISGIGVYGNTLTGSALKGISSSGYGLEVTGKVKIAGGNTSPGAGKVLTSDATGNATWQPGTKTPMIAFQAGEIGTLIPIVTETIWPFAVENYDYGNNFNMNTKKFTAPVAGLYHFDVNISMLFFSTAWNFIGGNVHIYAKQPGYATYTALGYPLILTNDAASATASGSPSITKHLVAGEEVWVTLSQNNIGGIGAGVNSHYATDNFSGYLIVAD